MAITFLPIQGQQSQINGSNALKQGTVQTEFLFQSVSKFKVFQNLEKKCSFTCLCILNPHLHLYTET